MGIVTLLVVYVGERLCLLRPPLHSALVASVNLVSTIKAKKKQCDVPVP